MTDLAAADLAATDLAAAALAERLRAEAAALGFDAIGFTTPAAIDARTGERLAEFIAAGRHGDMDWMAEHAARRRHPAALWPEARSIVMLGMSYAPASGSQEKTFERGLPSGGQREVWMAGSSPAMEWGERGLPSGAQETTGEACRAEGTPSEACRAERTPSEACRAEGKQSPRDRAAISVYAKGRDYHDILKSKLKTLARMLAAQSGAEVKVFVDTAPLMEKPLAAAAGLGWQGKHTNLVSRRHGSWLFLGAILTTAEIAPDAPEADHCGSCRSCLDACPTAAFPAPYQLDARRCLAYLSIEHKGPIPREFRKPMGNRVFGCDDCLVVCPWNKFAAAARETRFSARAETDDPPLAELLALDDAAFRARFAGTPVKRTGRDRIVRNALIAAGNAGDAALLPAVEACTGDNSPLVRGMAVWALSQLLDRDAFRAWADGYGVREQDPHVREELTAAATETL